ncbi:hypothetical protein V6N13_121645 [Hibiscus sabdariffa]
MARSTCELRSDAGIKPLSAVSGDAESPKKMLVAGTSVLASVYWHFPGLDMSSLIEWDKVIAPCSSSNCKLFFNPFCLTRFDVRARGGDGGNSFHRSSKCSLDCR